MDNAATLPDACSVALERYLDPTIFRALADPKRLALLARLAQTAGPLSVTELASQCGIHLSGVSRHLRMLHGAELIRADRQVTRGAIQDRLSGPDLRAPRNGGRAGGMPGEMLRRRHF